MASKSNVRICTDKETRKTFRLIAAELGIEINEAVRFAADFSFKHISDFKRHSKKLGKLIDKKA